MAKARCAKRVGAAKETKCAVTGKKQVNLKYIGAPGLKVFVAGSFNDWKAEKELVDKSGTGEYTCRLMLVPGDYQYKFVINGEWRIDEQNPNFAPNEFGSLNSVLTIK